MNYKQNVVEGSIELLSPNLRKELLTFKNN